MSGVRRHIILVFSTRAENRKKGLNGDGAGYGPALTNLTVKLSPVAVRADGKSFVSCSGKAGVAGKFRLIISTHCTLAPKLEIGPFLALTVAVAPVNLAVPNSAKSNNANREQLLPTQAAADSEIHSAEFS